MTDSRRSFLGKALAASGGFAAGFLSSEAKSTGTRKASGLPALTPDHQVIDTGTGKPTSRPSKEAHEPSSKDPRKADPTHRWIMVIDLAKCDGCKECTKACNKMHHIPSPREWLPVFVMKEAEEEAPYFMPKPCFHCDIPPCTKVCPVNATFKRADGLVLIDNTRCIGCRFCMAACPYSTRVFNWGDPSTAAEVEGKDYSPEWGYPRRRGTVEKCDFCPDMTAQGKLPACVDHCPMGAIYLGDENEDAVTNGIDQTVSFSKLLRERAGYQFMPELGTHPRVYYLPPKNRRYPAPDEREPKAKDKSSKGGEGK